MTHVVSIAPPTLVGVATGRPDGGVSIIRLSGARAFSIAHEMMERLPEARHAARRRLRLSATDDAGEDALVVCMPGPHSYTGEDVVELHVHAGERNVEHVVHRVLALGAQSAGPGEFTRRAFENGRLGLDEAEGIAALIGARTQAAVEQARRLVAGELGREVEKLRERVAALRVEIEAHLDFPEDVDDGARAGWAKQVEAQRGQVAEWLRQFEAGRRARERARFVLAGPPNAGKSSLFNALLGRPRALVASSPGTTRDYVEAELELGPYLAVLVDTAGLRATETTVEKAGVGLSRDQIAGADLVIWVESATEASPGQAVAELAELGTPRLAVENKTDRGRSRADWLGVSALSGAGIEALRERLQGWFVGDAEGAWIGMSRHRDRATETGDALAQAWEELRRERCALEIVSFQLGIAERRLGEVTGRNPMGPVGDSVLEAIFSRFCIGK
jgi:tRNA modification GTPase